MDLLRLTPQLRPLFKVESGAWKIQERARKMKKKRNTFTDAFKAKVALEACKGVKTANELATQYKVHPSQIAQWKKLLVSGAPEIFARGKNGQSATEEELTAPLYEEIGRLKMDIKWLEKKL